MSDSQHKKDDLVTLWLIASLRDDCRLLLVCDQLLDADIQPVAADFTIVAGEQQLAVVAVHLESPLPQKPTCSALILQTVEALPKSDKLRVVYRPTQCLMWSTLHDLSVASFDNTVPAEDKTLAEFLQQLPELELAPTDYTWHDNTPANRRPEIAPADQPLIRHIAEKAAAPTPAAFSTLRAPQVGDRRPLLDRLVAILMLCALSAGGLVVILLLYIAIQFFSGSFFAEEETAKTKVANFCSLNFDDGGRYEGQCVDGVGEGQGVYYYNNGDRYVGGWYAKNRHGAGIVTASDGKTMEGQWRNGVAYDNFTIKWPNGSRYVGIIENDVPHGEGTMTFANGDSYTGQFAKNLKQGQGIMKWSSGLQYEGRYENDLPNGFGIYTLPDGNRFEGMFVDGQVTQNGTCYLTDGTSVRGPCAQ